VSSGPDTTTDPRWQLLDDRTREQLVKAWHRDREVYRVLRDQALAIAAGHQRSLQHADRRRMDIFHDRAARQGVSDADRAAFVDLLAFPADEQQRLIELRQRDMVAYAVALGEARAPKAAEAAS
jgi:hypothetical protein